eukprot:jgi/Botrbrau1/16364/Bobra.0372s0003.1
MHTTMAELGFHQTYFLQVQNVIYQSPILQMVQPQHFTPSVSFRFTLMMQGNCLLPLEPEKQIALQSVLEPLMAAEGHVYIVRLERVASLWPAPQVKQDANGSIVTYYFVNATIVCAKYEGVGYKSLSWLFGNEGPFAVKPDGSPSAVQQEMERMGLPIVTIKTAALEIFSDQPIVTPRERLLQLISMEEQGRAWRQQVRSVIATAVVGLAIVLIFTGIRRAWKTWKGGVASDDMLRSPPFGFVHNHAAIEPGAAEAESPWWMERMQQAIQAQFREGSDGHMHGDVQRHFHNQTSEHFFREVAEGAPNGHEEGFENLLGGSNPGNQPLPFSRVDVDARTHNSYLQASSSLPPLWDADNIRPESLEIARRPDGTVWALGSGTFGKVLKGIRDGVHDVALKISKSNVSREAFLREVALLKSCRNSNIVQFQGACHVKGRVWLVMEYMPGGNLRNHLAAERNWEWGRRAAILALDIARGMAYLHSQNVIHLDLKSGNVLLTSDGRAKIADVGVAHCLNENRTHCSNLQMGTFAWMAPEIILERRAGFAADVYSFGVILWELVTGKLPVRGRLRELRVPEDCPEAVARLFARCQASNPADRPTAKDVAVQLQSILAQTPAVHQPPASFRTVSMSNPGSTTSSSAWAYDVYPAGA